MVQGADGCTMVTGASASIGPMTPQPLRFMCSGAVLPLQCFTLGVPTARLPADLCATLLYNAVVPCWRTFAQIVGQRECAEHRAAATRRVHLSFYLRRLSVQGHAPTVGSAIMQDVSCCFTK